MILYAILIRRVIKKKFDDHIINNLSTIKQITLILIFLNDNSINN